MLAPHSRAHGSLTLLCYWALLHGSFAQRNRHLNGTALESIERPGLLITDAGCMRVPGGPSKRRRDDFLGASPVCPWATPLIRGLIQRHSRPPVFIGKSDAVVQTVTDGGNVLVPCDSAGRVLELALMLDQV